MVNVFYAHTIAKKTWVNPLQLFLGPTDPIYFWGEVKFVNVEVKGLVYYLLSVYCIFSFSFREKTPRTCPVKRFSNHWRACVRVTVVVLCVCVCVSVCLSVTILIAIYLVYILKKKNLVECC